ncbi:MAG: hypothetical protein JWP00_3256 [Chloroflexi bacterium]|nr:hypothetical protein [Chloroflexota bacterium]
MTARRLHPGKYFMSAVTFYFEGDLNYFLPAGRRNTSFSHEFKGRVSIKDMIESLGVPHTEIKAIIANGRPVDLTYLVEEDAQIEVYGFPSKAPVGGQVRPPFIGEPRFVLDSHLGQLAVYLRMAGFDTLYRNDYSDDVLAQISSEEQRVLLSRDRGLFKRSLVVYGYYVRNVKPRQQVIEVIKRFSLADKLNPLHRCIRCNGLIQPVAKEAVIDRLEPLTRQYFNEFSLCPDCGQVYWKGSHYSKMLHFMGTLLNAVDDKP